MAYVLLVLLAVLCVLVVFAAVTNTALEAAKQMQDVE